MHQTDNAASMASTTSSSGWSATWLHRTLSRLSSRTGSGQSLFGTASRGSLARCSSGRLPDRVDGYEIIRQCGEGSTCTVLLGYCKDKELLVAIKQMDFESPACDPDMARRELAVMRDVRHPNVLPLHTTCQSTTHSLWIVTPYCAGGALGDRELRQAFPLGLPEIAVATVAKAVLSALQHLHTKAGYAHRDVKPDNILLTADGHIYLADLGSAVQVRFPSPLAAVL